MLFIYVIYLQIHAHTHDLFTCTLHSGVVCIYMTVAGITKLSHASTWTTFLPANSAKQTKQRTQRQSQALGTPRCYAQTATAAETQLLTACLGICTWHGSRFADSVVEISNHTNTRQQGTIIKMLNENTYSYIYRDLVSKTRVIINKFHHR